MTEVNLIKQIVLENIIGIDSVVYSRKLNQFRLRRDFFYRHGMTSAKLQESVSKQLAMLKTTGEIWDFKPISNQEVWNQWPKDSYFEACYEITLHDDSEMKEVELCQK